MKYMCVETKGTVNAKNYTEAAEKMFCCEYYQNPAVTACVDLIPTVYTERSKGFAKVKVYKKGDKQGTFWGVQATSPERYTLVRQG